MSVEKIEELLAQVPDPEPNLEFEAKWPHRQFHAVEMETFHRNYSTYNRETVTIAKREDADVVSSQTVNGNHAPAIDIDMGCRVVPSGTPGHFHLFIDKEMPWKQYLKLLKAMVKAGIVEERFYKMSKKQGATRLRLPEKPKGASRIPSGSGYGY